MHMTVQDEVRWLFSKHAIIRMSQGTVCCAISGATILFCSVSSR